MHDKNTPRSGRKLGLVMTVVATSLAAGCGQSHAMPDDSGALADAAPSQDAGTEPDDAEAAIDAAMARVDAESVDAGAWEQDADLHDAYYPDGIRG